MTRAEENIPSDADSQSETLQGLEQGDFPKLKKEIMLREAVRSALYGLPRFGQAYTDPFTLNNVMELAEIQRLRLSKAFVLNVLISLCSTPGWAKDAKYLHLLKEEDLENPTFIARAGGPPAGDVR